MSKRRYALKSGNNAPYELFNDAEDAWLWASANTELMLAGARGQPSLKPTQRPCEAADVLNAFERLMRAGTLAARHAQVAVRFGLRQRRPNGLIPSEQAAALLWEEAMDRLTTPLRPRVSFYRRTKDKQQSTASNMAISYLLIMALAHSPGYSAEASAIAS